MFKLHWKCRYQIARQAVLNVLVVINVFVSARAIMAD